MRYSDVAVLLLAILCFVHDAQAQDVQVHAGAGVVGDLQARGLHGSHDTESGYTVFAGARWKQGVGLEVAYADLGTISGIGITDLGFKADGSLWSLGVTYARRIEAFEPYAKLGWFTREEEGVFHTLVGSGPMPFDQSDDGFMAEVGLRWFIGDAFALRAGYAHYDFEIRGEGSVQLAAEYHF